MTTQIKEAQNTNKRSTNTQIKEAQNTNKRSPKHK